MSVLLGVAEQTSEPCIASQSPLRFACVAGRRTDDSARPAIAERPIGAVECRSGFSQVSARCRVMPPSRHDTMSAMGEDHRFVLTLSCPDRTGIVARITTFLANIGGWITEAAYHSDAESGRFFTRQEVRADSVPFGIAELRRRFGEIAADLAADHWQVADNADRKTVVLLVSKEGHCLYEVLARWHSGELTADIGVVIGNHPELEPVAQMFGLPFRLIPVPKDEAGKAAAFEQVRGEVDTHAPDAVVLARYMQVIPPDLCDAWAGRLINIHHGFLPSFRGARPYHQAQRPRRQDHRCDVSLRER